ncbi:putative short-chain dehydrogenases/reductase [Abortiporus biennis]|nr:putative short-chain dehydrogenases/reductase [Abortiporus biennis]
MPSYLITGASRGIGLGLVQQLLKNPENQVIATARNPSSSKGLQELREQYPDNKRLITLTLDVSKPEDIKKAAEDAEKLLPGGLDVLINNAAILSNVLATVDEIDTTEFMEELRINIVAVLEILRVFKPLVSKSTHKKIIVISSVAGSLELAPQYPAVGLTYAVTKAGVNMLARRWGKVYQNEGITTILIHPGWVATDMGLDGYEVLKKSMPKPPISVEESAIGIVKVIEETKFSDTVLFLSNEGTPIPW